MALSIQQRKNLEAAVRAATTAPSASNPLVTAAEQPWEEVSNVVRVKSGFGASGCRVGTDSSTATVDAQGEWDTVNTTGLTWSTNKWVWNGTTVGTDLTFGATVTANAYYQNNSQYAPGNSVDDDTSTIWHNGAGLSSGWLRVDLGSSQYITGVGYSMRSGDAVSVSSVEYSTNGTDYTDSGIASFSPSGTSITQKRFSSIISARYIRFNVGENPTTCSELEVYSTSGIVSPTTELCTGTQSFAPSSLKLYTTTAKSVELVDGEATVSFRKIIGGVVTGYGSQESLTTFRSRPASEFANCTSLKIKVTPVGANTFGALTIDAPSSSVITTKSGAVTIAVNDVTVYAVETDGDVIATDITADDITMTGDLSMDTTKTTIATIASTTDTTSATTIKSIAVGANQTLTIDADVIGNKAGASKASYRVLGTFFRNASGDITQLGDIVSLKTDEIVAGWDVSFSLTQSPTYAVNLQVTGEASVAWSAKITYNIA